MTRLFSLTLLLTGCMTGQARLQAAGEDTLLEYAELAVDPITGSVILASRSHRRGLGDAPRALWGLPAGETEALVLLDEQELSGAVDLRVVHSTGGPVVLFGREQQQHFVKLDPHSLEVHDHAVLPYDLHGTRVSPSRRWLLGSDNQAVGSGANLLLIDLETLEAEQVAWQGHEVEALWLPGDRIAGFVEYQPEGESVATQLMVWRDPATSDSPLSEPAFVQVLPASEEGDRPSYLRPTVSDDGTRLAVPVRRGEGLEAAWDTMLFDLRFGTSEVVPDVRGPVAFEEQGTLLGWRELTDPVGHQLVRVRLDNLEQIPIPLPWTRSPVPGTRGSVDFWWAENGYGPVYAMLDGEAIVAASGADQRLLALDEAGGLTTLDGPALGLGVGRAALVGSGELWVVGRGGLWSVRAEGIARIGLPAAARSVKAVSGGGAWVLGRRQSCLWRVGPDGVVEQTVLLRKGTEACGEPVASVAAVLP